MQLSYRYAVIGHCPDLTDPEAKGVPIAVLMIATCDDSMIAAATGYHPAKLDDPIAAALLKDVPRLLQEHVEEAWKQGSVKDTDSLLSELQHSLRNTLYITSISEPRVEEVDGEAISERAVQLLLEEVKTALPKRKRPPAETVTPPSRPSKLPIRPLTLFALPKRGAMAALTA